ncbi:serine/threonine protein kinase [Actinorugispora endophytica]|uniref:Serine/threonine protein kinase n=1 Tax=Actinorugispora endophytica TaxID=1605990 RepID=A0A4V6PWW2_9ACTN|nr:protein kinase [Actinorugispora endophytica]TDQ53620.1 serine/threonine protein kinase [Actinorugispora endophytica]
MSRSVGGYRITTDFTTAGGGQCRWAFAVRDGDEYFLKEFLAPTYPIPESPGSATTKERKLRKCEKFEEHHQSVTSALAPLSKTGGNLVTTRDFFREGAKYYKVTEKVDVTSLSPRMISREPVERRILVLLTVAHSLEILHRAGLVHGDLKPENILIKETAKGYYAAKLIDFDNAFFSGRPVPPEDMVGDPNYYSPEIFGYFNGGVTGERLTTASDVFALGLVAALFLTGRGAAFESVADAGRYPGELRGAGADCSTGLRRTARADALIQRMLSADPDERPTALQVFDGLKELRTEAKRTGGWPRETESEGPSTGRRLRGKLLEAAAPEPDAPKHAASGASGEGGRLRGSLLRGRDSSSA